jgi:ELWxxDGT repeat protein
VDIAEPPPAGAGMANMTPFADRLAFTADDGVHGVESWISDGTAAGMSLIADLTPGRGTASFL